MIIMDNSGNFVDNGIEPTKITTINISDVEKRLSNFGYPPTSEDTEQLAFETAEIISYVLNYCNITQIPTILNHRIIDRVCSEYLFNKKNSGTLEDFDYEVAVRQIKEGDTTVQYAVGQGEDTSENRFDSVVKQLERGFDKWLTPHRRLRW